MRGGGRNGHMLSDGLVRLWYNRVYRFTLCAPSYTTEFLMSLCSLSWFTNLRQGGVAMSMQEKPVFSRFPANTLNALLKGAHNVSPWQRPTEQMPRCSIVLSVPDHLVSLRPSHHNCHAARYVLDKHNETYVNYVYKNRCNGLVPHYLSSYRLNSQQSTTPAFSFMHYVAGRDRWSQSWWHVSENRGLKRSWNEFCQDHKKQKNEKRQRHDFEHDWWAKLLKEGFIAPFSLNTIKHIAPVIMIFKSNDATEAKTAKRCVVDYRYLNARSMRCMNGRLPRCEMRREPIVTAAASAPCFIKADLQSSFYCVPVHPNSKDFLGVERGLRRGRFNVLPMGLADGPDVLAAWLRWVLSHLPLDDRLSIFLYQDDFLILGSSAKDCELKFMRLTLLMKFFCAQFNPAKMSKATDSQIGVQLLGCHVRCGVSDAVSAGRITLASSLREKLKKRISSALQSMSPVTQSNVATTNTYSPGSQQTQQQCNHDHLSPNASLPYDIAMRLEGSLRSCDFLIPQFWDIAFPFSVWGFPQSIGCSTKQQSLALRKAQMRSLKLLLRYLTSDSASQIFSLQGAHPSYDLEFSFSVFRVFNSFAWEATISQFTFGRFRYIYQQETAPDGNCKAFEPRILWRFHGTLTRDKTMDKEKPIWLYPHTPSEKILRPTEYIPVGKLAQAVSSILRRAIPVFSGIQKAKFFFANTSSDRLLRFYVTDASLLHYLRRLEKNNVSFLADQHLEQMNTIIASNYTPLSLSVVFELDSHN